MTRFNHPVTRRQFVRASSTAAAFAALPAGLAQYDWPYQPAKSAEARAQARAHDERLAQRVEPDRVRDLAMRAIDAAKQAGATYADVHITRTVSQSFMGAGLFLDNEVSAISVRALVQGAWGFAASPYWEPDEAVQLARDAVAQAKFNARVAPRDIDMGSYPAVTGSWETPHRIDPFMIPIEEKTDYVMSLHGLFPTHIRNRRISGGLSSLGFNREERALATTEGTYCTQTLFDSAGQFGITLFRLVGGQTDGMMMTSARRLQKTAAGWEHILEANIPDQIPELIDEAEVKLSLPHKPVEIGRYDVVCDASTIANFIGATLGSATQLDRSMGSEANAAGTTYFSPDPISHLGTTMLGSPLLNVSGNRSMSGGLATVKWDAEGVEPDTVQLVSQGRLTDFQTTREQVQLLASWYQQRQRPLRSHGCAWSATAMSVPIQTTPNLSLTPGTEEKSFDQLVAGVKKGLAIMDGSASTDFQVRNGTAGGYTREIIDGKLGAVVDDVVCMFESSQLWKGLIAIGGPSSQEMIPVSTRKGQPAQSTWYSVTAVPGVLKNMTILNNRRSL